MKDIDHMVIRLLEDRFAPLFVYRFGSTVGLDSVRIGMDVDIAFMAGTRIPELALFDTAGSIAEKIGREVDLVDLRAASTVMCKEIVVKGICIHVSDTLKKDEFEMYTLSDYARLNEERKPVLEVYR